MNPVAGRGRARDKARALSESLRGPATVRVLETEGRGSATALAAEVAGEVERVVVVGGDGTLNEALNGLLLAREAGRPMPELGFLAAGTGNAAARAFALRTDPDTVAAVLATAPSMSIDIGMVHYGGCRRAFLLWLGAGWDAALIGALEDRREGVMGPIGLIRSIPGVLRGMQQYREGAIETEVDASPFGPYTSVVVANVAKIPFGGLVTRFADPSDGRLDVVGVPRMSVLGRLDLARRMLTSGLTSSQKVGHAPCREAILDATDQVPIQVDGELIGTLPATVVVNPGAVRFLKT